MAANHQRGDVTATLEGEVRVLRLTLGVLAELESALAAPSLAALVDHFESGDFTARDISELIAAGLRGAGGDASATEVGAMRIEGGVQGAARIAAALLAGAFGGEDVA